MVRLSSVRGKTRRFRGARASLVVLYGAISLNFLHVTKNAYEKYGVLPYFRTRTRDEFSSRGPSPALPALPAREMSKEPSTGKIIHRKQIDYTLLWPIALAPVIPVLGIALRCVSSRTRTRTRPTTAVRSI